MDFNSIHEKDLQYIFKILNRLSYMGKKYIKLYNANEDEFIKNKNLKLSTVEDLKNILKDVQTNVSYESSKGLYVLAGSMNEHTANDAITTILHLVDWASEKFEEQMSFNIKIVDILKESGNYVIRD